MANEYDIVNTIVPVYNSVKYIDNCVKSILSQSVNEEALLAEDANHIKRSSFLNNMMLANIAM